jgi:hypothetical protein
VNYKNAQMYVLKNTRWRHQIKLQNATEIVTELHVADGSEGHEFESISLLLLLLWIPKGEER